MAFLITVGIILLAGALFKYSPVFRFLCLVSLFLIWWYFAGDNVPIFALGIGIVYYLVDFFSRDENKPTVQKREKRQEHKENNIKMNQKPTGINKIIEPADTVEERLQKINNELRRENKELKKENRELLKNGAVSSSPNKSNSITQNIIIPALTFFCVCSAVYAVFSFTAKRSVDSSNITKSIPLITLLFAVPVLIILISKLIEHKKRKTEAENRPKSDLNDDTVLEDGEIPTAEYLEGAYRYLQSRYKNSRQYAKELEQKLDEANDRCDKLRNAYIDKSKNIYAEGLQKKIEYLQKELNKSLEERNQLRKDYAYIVNDLDKLEKKLDEAEKKLDEAERRAANNQYSRQSTAQQNDSSKEADKWRKAYETSRDEFRIAAQGRQEALDQIEKLKAELTEKDRIIENLKYSSNNIKKINSGLDPTLIESFRKIVSTLESATKDLPIYYYEIPIDPPKGNEDIAVLPVCAKFDKRFWVKMFLLRNHVVASQVISSCDLLDYQIPIKTENELLIVLVYWRRFTGVPLQYVHEPIGKDLTPDDEYEFQVCYNNTILHTVNLARHIENLVRNSGADCWNEFVMLPDYKSYQNCYAVIERWVDMMYEQISTSREFTLPVKWKSEYTLYKYFQVLFPDTIFQYHADWLGLQSLDMYIPSIHTAVEYQGKQHYEPVGMFGGEEKLAENRQRDAVKHNKCRSHGINLCYWEYTTKIRFRTILSFLDYAKIPRPDLEQSLSRNIPFPVAELFASAIDGK